VEVHASGQSAYALLQTCDRQSTLDDLTFIKAQEKGRYLDIEAMDDPD
jgi:hypothetical protein